MIFYSVDVLGELNNEKRKLSWIIKKTKKEEERNQDKCEKERFVGISFGYNNVLENCENLLLINTFSFIT